MSTPSIPSSTLKATPRNTSGDIDFQSVKLSLAAFREVLGRLMKPYVGNRIIMSFTPDSKRVLKLTERTAPPYMYLGVQSLTLLKDRTNVTAMSKAGLTVPHARKLAASDVEGLTGDNPIYLQEVKWFPVQLDLLITYVDVDAERTLDAGTMLLLNGMLRGFSFEAQYRNVSTEIKVRPVDPPAIQSQAADQWIDMENDDQPGFQSWSFPCTMFTNVFVFGQVPAMRKLLVRIADEGGIQNSIAIEDIETT